MLYVYIILPLKVLWPNPDFKKYSNLCKLFTRQSSGNNLYLGAFNLQCVLLRNSIITIQEMKFNCQKHAMKICYRRRRPTMWKRRKWMRVCLKLWENFDQSYRKQFHENLSTSLFSVGTRFQLIRGYKTLYLERRQCFEKSLVIPEKDIRRLFCAKLQFCWKK